VLSILILVCTGCEVARIVEDTSIIRAVLRPAPYFSFPGGGADSTDCNCPAHWDGNTLFLFNSCDGIRRSNGPDLFHMNNVITVPLDTSMEDGGYWIESTWKDADGALYAWYHNEPDGICLESNLTAPRIGAAVSYDNGQTFTNLGIIIETRDTVNCDAQNGFDAGGNGDFSVLPDSAKQYFYFFFSVYGGDISEQGVAVARMAFGDRKDPVNKVWKWHDNGWNEPGLKGLATPIFPAVKNWANAETDAFWGPSIHWNTHINRYVILLNRAKGPPGYFQEGAYVTFNPDIADPLGWTVPVRIFQGGWWYPQVVGIDPTMKETDKLAGRVARFFMHGVSEWEILFLNPDEMP
jgi:hypothetical protein